MSARRFAWSLVAVSARLAIPTAVLMIVQIGGFTPPVEAEQGELVIRDLKDQARAHFRAAGRGRVGEQQLAIRSA